MGCRCVRLPDTWYARCKECHWTFKITELIPSFDGHLVSLKCMKPGPAGATVRVPEEELCASAH